MLITERIYVLEDVDVQAFLGVNNSNLMLLRTLFPKLRLVAHHNVLKIARDGSFPGSSGADGGVLP